MEVQNTIVIQTRNFVELLNTKQRRTSSNYRQRSKLACIMFQIVVIIRNKTSYQRHPYRKLRTQQHPKPKCAYAKKFDPLGIDFYSIKQKDYHKSNRTDMNRSRQQNTQQSNVFSRIKKAIPQIKAFFFMKKEQAFFLVILIPTAIPKPFKLIRA